MLFDTKENLPKVKASTEETELLHKLNAQINAQSCFNEVEKGLDFYHSKYEKFILFGDLNCEPSDSVIRDFMDSYNFTNMVRVPTCFKSSNPTCIDLILTNGKGSLKSTATAETRLSDFHVMILTAIRSGFVKRGLRIKNILGL